MKKQKRAKRRLGKARTQKLGKVWEELVVGEIGDELLKRLYAVPDSVRMIDIHVCSPGGSFCVAVAAIEIFRRWQRKGKIVRVVALGEVCSSAVLIVAAGSPGYRYSYRSTLWGIHLPFTTGEVIEDAGAQRSEAALQKIMGTQCCRYLSEMSQEPFARWWKLLTQTNMVWRDGEGARALGLVDEVVPV